MINLYPFPKTKYEDTYNIQKHINNNFIKKSFNDKKIKIICALNKKNGQKWTSLTLRRECVDFLENKPYTYIPTKRLSRKEYFLLHEEYAFEISPFGNGVDCFRHWEAILCRTIPIIFSSYADSLFKNLPVIILNDLSELNENLLIENYEKYKDWWDTHNLKTELSSNKFYNFLK